MSFSAEIKDFINGVKAGADLGGDIQDRKLAREKWEFDKAFKQGSAARADRALDIRERGIGTRAADREARSAAKAADKEAKAAAKEADKAHKAEVKDFNEVVRSEGSGPRSSPRADYSDEWDDEFPEGDPATDESWDESALPVEEVTGEEVLFAAGGAKIEERLPDANDPSYNDPRYTVDDARDDMGLDPLAWLGRQTGARPTFPESTEGKSDKEEPQAAIPVSSSEGGQSVAEGKEDPVFKEAAEVTRDVMDTMEAELREQPEAVSTKKSEDRVAEVKPASPEEMKAIWAQVDPNGELDGQVKGAKTLVKAYRFFTEKGDAVKARKIAAQIIKFNQDASKTQGMLALEALRAGDLASASRLITDAATENVPDGVTVQAEPTPKGTVLYKIDKAGYAQQQGELGAAEMWKLAAGVADGSMFLQRMAVLAGQAEVGAEKPVVTSDGKKGGKKRNWNDALSEAAQAKVDLEAAQKRFEEYKSLNGSEPDTEDPELAKEFATYEAAVNDAMAAYQESVAILKRGAKATKRSPEQVAKEFNAALKFAVPGGRKEKKGEGEESALPTGADPAAGPAYNAENPPPQEGALPTAPAAPAGRPMDPETMAKAKAAIAEGRSRAGVIEKLKKMGFNTEGL